MGTSWLGSAPYWHHTQLRAGKALASCSACATDRKQRSAYDSNTSAVSRLATIAAATEWDGAILRGLNRQHRGAKSGKRRLSGKNCRGAEICFTVLAEFAKAAYRKIDC